MTGGAKEAFDPDLPALAARVLQPAREEDATALFSFLARGVPPNLCNDEGDNLVMLAVHNG